MGAASGGSDDLEEDAWEDAGSAEEEDALSKKLAEAKARVEAKKAAKTKELKQKERKKKLQEELDALEQEEEGLEDSEGGSGDSQDQTEERAKEAPLPCQDDDAGCA